MAARLVCLLAARSTAAAAPRALECLAAPAALQLSALAQRAAGQQVPPCVPQLWRSLSSSSAPAGAAQLSSVLKDEISHEKEAYEAPPVVAKGPPAPFTLTEEPINTLLTLKRKYNDEEVVVNCSVNHQSLEDEDMDIQEEGDEEGTGDNIDVMFNVSVEKGGESLVFQLISDGTYVDIKHVSLEPADGYDSDLFYTGPIFDELDEALQSELRTYLAERGIDEALGDYLRNLVYDKEQREYMNWLKRVQKFVS